MKVTEQAIARGISELTDFAVGVAGTALFVGAVAALIAIINGFRNANYPRPKALGRKTIADDPDAVSGTKPELHTPTRVHHRPTKAGEGL